MLTCGAELIAKVKLSNGEKLKPRAPNEWCEYTVEAIGDESTSEEEDELAEDSSSSSEDELAEAGPSNQVDEAAKASTSSEDEQLVDDDASAVSRKSAEGDATVSSVVEVANAPRVRSRSFELVNVDIADIPMIIPADASSASSGSADDAVEVQAAHVSSPARDAHDADHEAVEWPAHHSPAIARDADDQTVVQPADQSRAIARDADHEAAVQPADHSPAIARDADDAFDRSRGGDDCGDASANSPAASYRRVHWGSGEEQEIQQEPDEDYTPPCGFDADDNEDDDDDDDDENGLKVRANDLKRYIQVKKKEYHAFSNLAELSSRRLLTLMEVGTPDQVSDVAACGAGHLTSARLANSAAWLAEGKRKKTLERLEEVESSRKRPADDHERAPAAKIARVGEVGSPASAHEAGPSDTGRWPSSSASTTKGKATQR